MTSTRMRWALVGPALVVPCLLALVYFVLLPGTAVGNGLYVFKKIMLVVWPLLATACFLKHSIHPRAWLGTFRWRDVTWGALLGSAIVAAMFALMQWPLFASVIEAGSQKILEQTEGMGVKEHFLLFALFLSLIHSLIEEVYWRWFVHGQLSTLWPRWAAHGVAALGFSSHHIVVLSQFFPLWMAILLGLCVGLGGLFWSLMKERQGGLWGAWISHMIVDLGIMWLGAGLMGLR